MHLRRASVHFPLRSPGEVCSSIIHSSSVTFLDQLSSSSQLFCHTWFILHSLLRLIHLSSTFFVYVLSPFCQVFFLILLSFSSLVSICFVSPSFQALLCLTCSLNNFLSSSDVSSVSVSFPDTFSEERRSPFFSREVFFLLDGSAVSATFLHHLLSYLWHLALFLLTSLFLHLFSQLSPSLHLCIMLRGRAYRTSDVCVHVCVCSEPRISHNAWVSGDNNQLLLTDTHTLLHTHTSTQWLGSEMRKTHPIMHHSALFFFAFHSLTVLYSFQSLESLHYLQF